MTIPRARTLGLAGLAGFVGLVAAQHIWRADDLPPAEHFVSEYAVGDGGWVQVVAFLAWAGSLAATVAVARRAHAGGERRIARSVVLAGVTAGAVGAVACAAFATETVGGELPAGVVKSTAGQLHDLGSAFIFFGLLIAGIASVRLVRRRSYRLSVLALAVLLFLIPGALIALGYDAPGWGQRGFIAVGCLWQWRFLQASSVSES
jgi:hypothetical protein